MRALVIGHSFIARYQRYLHRQLGPAVSATARPRPTDYKSVFNLDVDVINVSGKGGLKIDQCGVDFIKKTVDDCRPELIILELGTNDLSEPSRVANDVFVQAVIRQLDGLVLQLKGQYRCIKTVVVCQVISRRRLRGGLSVVDFRERQLLFNAALQQLARRDRLYYVFKHDRTLLVNLSRALTNDDIHLTTAEALRLYHFSIRRAIVKGLGHISNIYR